MRLFLTYITFLFVFGILLIYFFTNKNEVNEYYNTIQQEGQIPITLKNKYMSGIDSVFFKYKGKKYAISPNPKLDLPYAYIFIDTFFLYNTFDGLVCYNLSRLKTEWYSKNDLFPTLIKKLNERLIYSESSYGITIFNYRNGLIIKKIYDDSRVELTSELKSEKVKKSLIIIGVHDKKGNSTVINYNFEDDTIIWRKTLYTFFEVPLKIIDDSLINIKYNSYKMKKINQTFRIKDGLEVHPPKEPQQNCLNN